MPRFTRYGVVARYPLAGALFRPWPISNAYEALTFIRRHRRLPRFGRSGLFNDMLFALRAGETDYVLRAFTSDKEFVKLFVRGVTGEDLCVPTLDVIRSAEAVDGYAFPAQSVAKPTHSSGEVVFVGDDPPGAGERERMKTWFRVNHADQTGERHYARLEPKIIVEPWLRLNGKAAQDFKMHVYRGRMTLVDHVGDRHESNANRRVFDRDWREQEVYFPEKHGADWQFSPLPEEAAQAMRPKQWTRMVEIAETIGAHFPYVRVDFYTDGEDVIHIGELTHVSDNARKLIRPVEFEKRYVTG